MKRAITLFALLMLALPATAHAADISSLFVCSDGSCQDLTGFITRAGDLSYIDQSIALADGNQLQLQAAFDADPFITFTTTTTNVFTGPITYTFLFGTPIVQGLYDTAAASGTLTVTPGQFGGTVVNSVTYPTYISGYAGVGVPTTNLGIDLGSGSCSATCNFGSITTTFAPTFYDTLQAMLTYEQTGFGSVASFSGRIDLTATAPTPVPEPTALSLLACGLSGLVARALRRRRA